MANLKTLWRPTFADAVKRGAVLSVHRDGSEPVEVIAEPVRAKNLVGERSFVHLRARLWGTDFEGDMTFAASNVVYVRAGRD